MKNQLLTITPKYYLWSVPILFAVGSFFHFLYNLAGNSPIIGAFSAVNESVWEHQKMVLLPVIGWWIVVFLLSGSKNKINRRKWFTGLIASLIVSIFTIPFAFYFYSEAFGVHLIIVDALILLFSIVVGQSIGIHIYKHSKGIPFYASIIIVSLILLVFIVFTFHAPELPWFKDSLTGQYGI